MVSIQKKAIRHVALDKYNAHTGPLFRKLELLTLSDMINFSRALFIHKLVNDRLPEAFSNYFQYLKQMGNDRNRADDGNIFLPTFRFNKIFPPKWEAIKYWNSLPKVLRSIEKESEFRDELKRFMIAKYQLECDLLVCKACGRK